MSWDDHPKYAVARGCAAAVLFKDGTIYGKAGALTATVPELTHIQNCFKNPGTWHTAPVNLGGKKHMVLQTTDITAELKLGPCGASCFLTNGGILGVYFYTDKSALSSPGAVAAVAAGTQKLLNEAGC